MGPTQGQLQLGRRQAHGRAADGKHGGDLRRGLDQAQRLLQAGARIDEPRELLDHRGGCINGARRGKGSLLTRVIPLDSLVSLDVVILLIQPILKGSCIRPTENIVNGEKERYRIMLERWGGWR